MKTETVMQKVKNSIESAPGRFWRLGDFSDLSLAATSKALARLCAEGMLLRCGKGLYFHSRKTILGTVPPAPLELAKQLACNRRIVLADLSAYNRLALTTQMPAQAIVATECPLNMPNIKIILRNLSKYGSADDDAIMLLDALGHLEKIPDTNPTAVLKDIALRLRMKFYTVQLDQLAELALHERPKTRAMVGLLGEMTGLLSKGMSNRLRESLNPLTRFKLGMKDLPVTYAQLQEWHVEG